MSRKRRNNGPVWGRLYTRFAGKVRKAVARSEAGFVDEELEEDDFIAITLEDWVGEDVSDAVDDEVQGLR